MPKTVTIGIDLGTSKSCAAAYFNGNWEVIPSGQGDRTIPSYVSYEDPVPLVGEAARRQSPKKCLNTVFGFKRMLGRWFEDPLLQRRIKLWPFDVISDNNRPIVTMPINDEIKTVKPEEISAEILKKLKLNAETYLNCKVTKAVVTVPAYFNDNQRLATKEACELAGLELLAFIDDTVAAAIAYTINRDEFFTSTKRKILVFDLGGGSLEVAIIEIANGNYNVLAIRGDGDLGGEDFSMNLLNSLVKKFRDTTNLQISDKVDLAKLRNASEKAKEDLNLQNETEIELLICQGHAFLMNENRSWFDILNSELFGKCQSQVDMVLRDAGLTPSDIEDVLMVGGGTRMVKIPQMLETMFPNKLRKGINLEEAMAIGAAIRAASLTLFLNVDITIKRMTPFATGTKKDDNTMDAVIRSNQLTPVRKYKTCSALLDSGPLTIAIYQSPNEHIQDHEFVANVELNLNNSQQVINFEIDCEYGLLKVISRDDPTKSNYQNLKLKREHSPHRQSKQTYASGILNEIASLNICDQKETDRLLAINNIKTFCNKMTTKIEEDCLDGIDINNQAVNSLRDSLDFLNNNPFATEEEIHAINVALIQSRQNFSKHDYHPN